MNLLKWLIIFIPALLIEFFCYLTAPLVALFVQSEPRFDRVKRLGNKSATLQRDYLIKPFYWWQTHDNAVDEWWYGMFNADHYFAFARSWTQACYDNHAWIRYYCRLMWLWRNCAYGFHYNLFSAPVEPFIKLKTTGDENKGFWYKLETFEHSFQLEAHIPFLNFFLMVGFIYLVEFIVLNPSVYYALPIFLLGYWAALDNRYFSVNMGWKSHKDIPRKMYANRIPPFGIRKFK